MPLLRMMTAISYANSRILGQPGFGDRIREQVAVASGGWSLSPPSVVRADVPPRHEAAACIPHSRVGRPHPQINARSVLWNPNIE